MQSGFPGEHLAWREVLVMGATPAGLADAQWLELRAGELAESNQLDLDTISLSEAKRYYNEGHFAKGSMGPKVKAVINYLERGGNAALITMPETIGKALERQTGTWIVRE